MTELSFPYGKEKITHTFGEELVGVLTSSIEEYKPEMGECDLVRAAMASPVGSERLSSLAKGKRKVVLIASDHTRPVPSKVIVPFMLREIREGNPDADITILIATGCHRGTTKEELIAKFGEEIVRNEKIYIHDCDEREMLVSIGVLPSGGVCEINRLAAECDLLVAEGFIEPHLFAGFSGGRKSVLPGIAGRSTVLANHCAEFIASDRARTGILDGNPIHTDMLWAAKRACLRYVVNVVLDADKRVIYAVAGDVEEAHRKGTDFLFRLCGARAVPSDIAITTNGGYPLDQNVYQAVKGMTAAEATVKEGGVVIMLARSNDGTGGEHFYRQLADASSLTALMEEYLSRGRNETLPDQWMAQILTRILLRARVVYVSEMNDDEVYAMHMIPAHSLSEALEIARGLVGREDATVTAVPDGISVMVTK